ncbi:chemotaxis protein CheA [Haladaptatus sp. F3-133]|uniref:Chemotaxis protein CheA n=1 Tax=Halorutilus salinus TaxID=2487751 RepID=A0A9Q4C3H2_9EURY|nr:chemotaxis protein CheA [Halorutilus salinus]MCX2818417.1 chemotaxis protein CheA [Halorutilus salinus]
MSDRMEAFVAETEEDIVSLSNSLLDLEREGDDEVVEEVFRTAHTVKGSFAAMGFGNASEVAHAMEDVLDAIRSGEVEPTADVVDDLFEGVDALEECLDDVRAEGEAGSYDEVVRGLRRRADGDGSEEATEMAEGGDVEKGGKRKVVVAEFSEETGQRRETLGEIEDIDDAELFRTVPDRNSLGTDEGEVSAVAVEFPSEQGVSSLPLPKAESTTVFDSREEALAELDVQEDEGDSRERKLVIFRSKDTEKSSILDSLRDEGVEIVEKEEGNGSLNAVGFAPPDYEADIATEGIVSATVVEDEVGILNVTAGASQKDGSKEVTRLLRVGMRKDEFPGVAATAALDDIDDFDEVTVVGTEPGRDRVEEGDYDSGFDVEVKVPSGFTPDASEIRKTESVSVVEKDETEEKEEKTGDESEVSTEDEDGGSEEGDRGVEETEDNPVMEEDEDSQDTEDSGEEGGSEEDVAIQNVRVGVDRLDGMMNNVSELVINKIQIQHAAEEGDLEGVRKAADKLDKLSERLRDDVMQARLVPLKKITGRYPRVVRDVARETGKEVDFEVKGEEIELDRSILEDLKDPIVHLLKNSVDHGIEMPEERVDAGKPRRGTVVIEAERFSDRVEIRIRDDGAGMNPDELRRKGVEEGVLTEDEAEGMSDEEAYDLVFESGLSTKEDVTGTSGRGVGMSALKEEVLSNDGNVSVSSSPGEGTVTTLTLPVDVAVVQALLVGVGDKRYAVPTNTVDAIESAKGAKLKTVRGRTVCVVDDEPRPILSLPKKFSADGGNGTEDKDMILHIRDSVREASIRCDEVYGQQEIVVQPFEGFLAHVEEFSGTAILGRGEIVPVVEVNEL